MTQWVTHASPAAADVTCAAAHRPPDPPKALYWRATAKCSQLSFRLRVFATAVSHLITHQRMLTPSTQRRRSAPVTPLNQAGQGRQRPGTVLSAARRIGDATAERNGRSTANPTIAVAPGHAAAVVARHERALQRLLDPLLEDDGSVGGGRAGNMAPETRAFDALPEQDRLPPHPPLDMMLRGEDGATHQLPRFGGARGSHRALPSYKFLMTEKLRIASLAQLRASGAPRVHAMLRAHASCFSSLVFTAYSAGIVSDAALEAADGPQAYALLCAVFSLGAARLHCREIEVAAEQRAIRGA